MATAEQDIISTELPDRLSNFQVKVFRGPHTVDLEFLCCEAVYHFGANSTDADISPAILGHVCRHPNEAKEWDDLLTGSQAIAIRAIARNLGLYAEADCLDVMKVDLNKMSKRAASRYIDDLKGRQRVRQLGRVG